MSAAEKLKQIRKETGMTVRAVAEELGIPSSTYAAYEDVQKFKKPHLPMDLVKRLAIIFGRHDIGYKRMLALAGIDVDGSKDGDGQLAVIGASEVAASLGVTMIPEVDISYSMGRRRGLGDYPESRLVPFREDWIARLVGGGRANVFLATGFGDSMTPTIQDADDVLINRAETQLTMQDKIWALGYGELGMIKRVRRRPNGVLELTSDNPVISPIEASVDEVTPIGRVIWIGRRI